MLSPLKSNARSSRMLGNFSRICSNVSVENHFSVISLSYAQDCFFEIRHKSGHKMPTAKRSCGTCRGMSKLSV